MEAPTQAADLVVRSSMGSISAWNELAPAFTRRTGRKVIVTQETAATMERALVSDAPGDLHEYIVFAVAIVAGSKEQEAARELIRFVTSPDAAPLLHKAMMEPARP